MALPPGPWSPRTLAADARKTKRKSNIAASRAGAPNPMTMGFGRGAQPGGGFVRGAQPMGWGRGQQPVGPVGWPQPIGLFGLAQSSGWQAPFARATVFSNPIRGWF